MSNSYYDWALGDRFIAFDTVRSDDANAALDSVTLGFDKLPSPLVLWSGGGNYAADTGAANAYVVSIAATYVTSYYDGMQVRVKPTNANSGTSTINVNGLGLKTLKRPDNTVLQTGDILAGYPFIATYNSTTGCFHMASASAGTGAAGAAGTSGTVIYEERASTAATLVTADAAKKIKYTGAGAYTLTIDSVGNLAAGWRTQVWNGTSSYIQVTSDGATYKMYPGEEREFYRDPVNNRINSFVLRRFRLTDQAAGSFVVPPGYAHLVVRATGSAQGGGGGGGGGSGRGVNSSSGSGGSGASGGAAGQNGQTVTRRMPVAIFPAVGTSIAYAPGAAGTKGTKGNGAVGATSGNQGQDGNDGTSGSAGSVTTFGTATDEYFVTAAGGTAGVNLGLKGLAGLNNNAGGAAVTNNATAGTGSIKTDGSLVTPQAIGTASAAGTTQTSAAPGTAGGRGGDTPVGYSRITPRSGATFAAGGAINSNAVPSPGNAGTTPAAETSPGVGGLGGGGGGGSPGVGAGASAATGAGGAGGDGANGGPGEIEIWGEAA